MIRKMINAGACFLLLASCNTQQQETPKSVQIKGDTINITTTSTLHSKLKILQIAEKEFSTEFTTTGTVQAMAGKMAEVSPIFKGRISQNFATLGQKVTSGTPLFELYSSEFTEMIKNYFQARQALKIAESNFKRQKDLVEHGIGVARELEEAETEYEQSQKEYESTLATLQMLNVKTDNLTVGQPLTIHSPIAGDVVQSNITIGQYVAEDADPLVVIADLSSVWVVAQVKEHYIGSINKDDQVEIKTDATPDKIIAGRVSHINELLDEQTRSVQVLVTCANSDRQLKSGMFVGVHFIQPPRPSIIVPSTALLQAEDHTYLFVETAPNTFVRRQVTAVNANGTESLIKAGLHAGEKIISEGGIYLLEN